MCKNPYKIHIKLDILKRFSVKCAKTIAKRMKNKPDQKPVGAKNGKRVDMWRMCEHV